MTTYDVTDRNRVRRVPKRGAYDQETVHSIIDNALIGHVAFVIEDQPYVIPTLVARNDDALLLHGAVSSRLMRHAASGEPLSIAVTHVDGLVLARSVFHHSVNYRSVVIFGSGQPVADPAAKVAALEQFTEKLLPGRWQDARVPNDTELKATAVVSVPIDTASAKVRSGPPSDDEDDYALPIWAGVLPLETRFAAPQADARLDPSISLPDYLATLVNRDP